MNQFKTLSFFLAFSTAATSLFAGSFSFFPDGTLNPPDTSLIVCKAITETGLPVNEVTFELNVPSVPLTISQTTDILGKAVFEPLDSGIVFNINASKDIVPSNGVTVGDLIALSKHILGLQALGSPYKLIAADANRSGSITTLDIVQIRRVILGIDPEFPNSPSWRMIPSDYIFPNPANPFQQIGSLPATVFTAPVQDVIEFTGIKIGDVNNTADPAGLTTFDERDLQTLFFETENKKIQAGEEFIATFTGSEAAEGFQFTLHTGDLDILEVLPGMGMSAEHFAVFPAQKAMTVACEAPGKARFALKLRSHRAGDLRDLLRIDSEITQAEAYLPASADREAEAAHVALGFSETGEDFNLYQNQPNPASGYTDIGFYLPADSDATLMLFDAEGRVVHSKSSAYRKGYNVARIELIGVAPGVLYYQLQAGNRCAIRKMVRI